MLTVPGNNNLCSKHPVQQVEWGGGVVEGGGGQEHEPGFIDMIYP